MNSPRNTELSLVHKVTLEQWNALIAVIDAGGFARAAEQLGKSQSSVSYAINQLEMALGVKVFALQGRRAQATPAGEVLYRRAKVLLAQACALEAAAGHFSEQVEPLVRVAVDQIVPPALVVKCLAQFAKEYPNTRVEFFEGVLSGTEEVLLQRKADIAIVGRVPPGFMGDHLLSLNMHAVSNPKHPLQALGRDVGYDDLRQHRQIVVRDSGQYRRMNEGWLEADQRLTVSSIFTSIAAVSQGLGYAWLAEIHIRDELDEGNLARLRLEQGETRIANLAMVLADRDFTGPATKRLAAIFKERLPLLCREAPLA